MICVFPLDWVYWEVQLVFSEKLFHIISIKLQRSKKLCSKAFSQQPITSTVAMNDSKASVVEFSGSGQPPLILPSSQLDDWCSFSYASIEHKIYYID